MADNWAIVSTKKPKEEVDDRTLAVINSPTKEADMVHDRTITVINPSAKEADMETAEVTDEKGAVAKKKKRSKKVLCCWCCGLIIGVLLLLGIIIIILVFTVFKVRNVSINVTKLTLEDVTISALAPTFDLTIKAELDTNANVHNPNVAGFKYGSSTVQVFYRGEQVAEAPIAAGQIKAHGTEQIAVPIQVTLSDAELINSNLSNDVFEKQMLPLVSQVYIIGTAEFGFFHIHNVRVHSTCNIDYFLNNETQSLDCQYSTKI